MHSNFHFSNCFSSETVTDDNIKSELKKFSVYTLILGAQQLGDGSWTCDENRVLAKKTLANLCAVLRCNKIEEILRGSCNEWEILNPAGKVIFNKGLMKDILPYMMPKLTKELWKSSPAYVTLYEFVMYHIKVCQQIFKIVAEG